MKLLVFKWSTFVDNMTLGHRMEVKNLVHPSAATIFPFLISVSFLPAEILNAMFGKTK